MTQVAASAEISNAITTIYGAWGLGHFDDLAEGYPPTPDNQLVADFQQNPCSQYTEFFRHKGVLEGFVTYTLPGLIHEDGEVMVTQIGATGQETWSLAVLLDGIRAPGSFTYAPYALRGYNVNQQTLDKAYGPFDTSLAELSSTSAAWVGMPALGRCLEDTAEGLRPRPATAERATFNRHDILQGPVPGDKANTLVMSNILWHYPEETRGHMMANALKGLRSGGAFLFEGWTADSRNTPGYAEWVTSLRQRGLFPHPEKSVNTVLKYVPEAATKPFEQSAAINEAFGVLAAAREEK